MYILVRICLNPGQSFNPLHHLQHFVCLLGFPVDRLDVFPHVGVSQVLIPVCSLLAVALSLLDDLNKANQKLDSIRNQTKEYVDEAGKTRVERDAAQKEIEVLKSKIVQLENMVKLKQLKDSI